MGSRGVPEPNTATELAHPWSVASPMFFEHKDVLGYLCRNNSALRASALSGIQVFGEAIESGGKPPSVRELKSL